MENIQYFHVYLVFAVRFGLFFLSAAQNRQIHLKNAFSSKSHQYFKTLNLNGSLKEKKKRSHIQIMSKFLGCFGVKLQI